MSKLYFQKPILLICLRLHHNPRQQIEEHGSEPRVVNGQQHNEDQNECSAARHGTPYHTEQGTNHEQQTDIAEIEQIRYKVIGIIFVDAEKQRILVKSDSDNLIYTVIIGKQGDISENSL